MKVGLGAVHQARVQRPVGVLAERLVGVVVGGLRAGRRGGRVVVVVLDAGVARGLGGGVGGAPALGGEVGGAARLREERGARVEGRVGDAAVEVQRRPALDQLAGPAELVALGVVGLVAGHQGEVHGVAHAVPLRHDAAGHEAVDLPDRGVDHERVERLLGPPRGAGAGVGELDPGRRFLVGELEVGQLGEVGERAAPGLAAALRGVRRPGRGRCSPRSPAGR